MMSIRDIRRENLDVTPRLLELHRRACALGLAEGNEAGRLDFAALAERARCHGHRAGALFFWLLRERETAFIPQDAKDAARNRLREHRDGPTVRERWGRGLRTPPDRVD